jgi:D-glycero-beta-D-manno-heptose-7-phosphate kinase
LFRLPVLSLFTGTLLNRNADSEKNLTHFVKEFSRRRILIVGDVIADQFVYGAISRVSREAPVFILRHEQTETLPGGAANAAVNVAALGGDSVLVGVTGRDEAGGKLREKLAAENVETQYLVEAEGWLTTTKVRILAGQTHAPRQQVIRLDYENEGELSVELQDRLAKNIVEAAADASAIVVSDYNYGVANARIAGVLREISASRNIPLLVDSRFRLRDFRGAASATPNQDEVEHLLEQKFTNAADFETICARLREELNFEALLVTRGADGMLLIERDKEPVHLSAIGSLEPVDVTGAGDTVMASYALAIASGATFAEAAALANHAGGIVVMKRGTATVTAEELLKSLQSIAETRR